MATVLLIVIYIAFIGLGNGSIYLFFPTAHLLREMKIRLRKTFIFFAVGTICAAVPFARIICFH